VFDFTAGQGFHSFLLINKTEAKSISQWRGSGKLLGTFMNFWPVIKIHPQIPICTGTDFTNYFYDPNLLNAQFAINFYL